MLRIAMQAGLIFCIFISTLLYFIPLDSPLSIGFIHSHFFIIFIVKIIPFSTPPSGAEEVFKLAPDSA